MFKTKKNIIIGIILGISIALFTIFITQKLIFKKNKIDNNTIKENKIEKNINQEENQNIIEKEEIKNIEKTTTTKSIKKNNNTSQNNKPKTNNSNYPNQNNNQEENQNNDNNNELNNTNENQTNNENDNENTTNNEFNNTLNIDLYYSETCPHCHAFMEYYDTLDENITSKIIFNKYEISTIENINNITKYLDVSKKINSTCGGVPFIVFNEEDYMCGFADSLIETFLEKLRHYGIIN